MKAPVFLLCAFLCAVECGRRSQSDANRGEGRADLGGANSAFFLMEFDIHQILKPNTIVGRIGRILRAVPADNEGNGELVWLFKVLGENKVVAVTKNTPEPFWEAVTRRLGNLVTVTTTPLRPYEHFAQSINKVDPSLCGPAPMRLQPGLNERIYYIDVLINYKGFTIEDLRTTWPKESKLMLADRAAGKLQMEFFKVIGSNRVIVFTVSHPDGLDDLTFRIPLVVDLGDNLQLPIEEIVPL